MPRLREINPKLDNQLKSINNKILAAARVSTDSVTYHNLLNQVKMIAAATKQDKLSTKTVKGKAIPQLSRANAYYAGLKAGNSIQVQSIAAQAQRESITAEMKKFAQSSGKGFAKTKAFKEDFKNVLAQQVFQKKKDKLMSGDSTIANLLRDLPAGSAAVAFTEQVYEYMYSDYYDKQGYIEKMVDYQGKLEEDDQVYASKIDELEREIVAETDSEKRQALQDLLESTARDRDLIQNKLEDLKDYLTELSVGDAYKDATSEYYTR